MADGVAVCVNGVMWHEELLCMVGLRKKEDVLGRHDSFRSTTFWFVIFQKLPKLLLWSICVVVWTFVFQMRQQFPFFFVLIFLFLVWFFTSCSQQCFSYVGRVFLYVYIYAGLMCLAQGHNTQCHWWGSDLQPLNLKSSTLASQYVYTSCSSIFLVHIYLQCCRGVRAAAPIILTFLT